LTDEKPSSSHIAFSSLIASLPVPPTLTARSKATQAVM